MANRDAFDGLVYQAYALLEQDVGNHDRARELLERGTRKDPGNVYLWSARGVFETRMGNLTAACDMFEQVSFHFSCVCTLVGAAMRQK